jgi:hypothetical protein
MSLLMFKSNNHVADMVHRPKVVAYQRAGLSKFETRQASESGSNLSLGEIRRRRMSSSISRALNSTVTQHDPCRRRSRCRRIRRADAERDGSVSAGDASSVPRSLAIFLACISWMSDHGGILFRITA